MFINNILGITYKTAFGVTYKEKNNKNKLKSKLNIQNKNACFYTSSCMKKKFTTYFFSLVRFNKAFYVK